MCENPSPLKITRTSREYGKLNLNLFKDLLAERLREITTDGDDPVVLSEMLESLTLSVLDEVCPVTTRVRVVNSRLPWYSNMIHEERRTRRQLEHRWRKSRSDSDFSTFTAQKPEYVS